MAVIFLGAVLLVAVIFYRQFARAVEVKTNDSMTLFIDNIIAEYVHLGTILDVTKQVLNEKHIAIAQTIDDNLSAASYDLTPEQLQQIAGSLDIVELNIVDSEGILLVSNDAALIGFDYKSGSITEKYLALTNGITDIICEEPRLSVVGDGIYAGMNHYVGIPRSDGGGFLQIGFNADTIQSIQNEINIENMLRETRISTGGYGLVLSDSRIAICPDDTLAGRVVSGEVWYETVTGGEGFVWIYFLGERNYAGYKNIDGITVVALVPYDDYYRELNQALMETAVSLVLAVIVMVAVIYAVLSKRLSPIKELVAGLEKIGKGDFDTRIEGSYNDEFDEIKDAVNDMTENLQINIEQREQAEYESNIDALTGIRNRRYLDENLSNLMKVLSRSGSMLSVMMIDIDHFKMYNDTHGHTEGDKCLKAAAKVLQSNITRDNDVIVRYGGDEFAVIMPSTGEAGARDIAERMLRDMRNLKIPHSSAGIAEYVTFSVGITTGKVAHTQSGDDYIRRADEMLYKSKQEGRDRYSFGELG